MKTCSFSGCDRPHEAKGLCVGHYNQMRAGKALTPLGRRARTSGLTPEQRFWFYVEKTEDCWLWRGSTDACGYGQLKWGGIRKAHRVSYELAHGPIAPGLVIDHKCHVANCVNPEHLQAVSQKENSENYDKSSRPEPHRREPAMTDLTAEAVAAVLVRHPYSYLRGGRYVCSGCGAPAGVLGSGMNAAHAAHLGNIVAFIIKTATQPTGDAA